MLTLLVLAWALEVPGDAFAAGLVKTPWRMVGALLFGKLNQTLPIRAAGRERLRPAGGADVRGARLPARTADPDRPGRMGRRCRPDPLPSPGCRSSRWPWMCVWGFLHGGAPAVHALAGLPLDLSPHRLRADEAGAPGAARGAHGGRKLLLGVGAVPRRGGHPLPLLVPLGRGAAARDHPRRLGALRDLRGDPRGDAARDARASGPSARAALLAPILLLGDPGQQPAAGLGGRWRWWRWSSGSSLPGGRSSGGWPRLACWLALPLLLYVGGGLGLGGGRLRAGAASSAR